MKAIIEFDLSDPEDERKYRLCNSAEDADAFIYDLDERILHALFNELKIFIEKKRNFKFEVDSEVDNLYNWWTEERPKRPDPFKECSEHEVSEDLTKMLEEQYDEDTEKLVELIRLRNKLWN